MLNKIKQLKNKAKAKILAHPFLTIMMAAVIAICVL